MNDYRQQVANRFGSAALTYDAHSEVQRHAARQLAQRIATASLPPRPRVLELGCGTGHLTTRLLTHLPGAQIRATDIAPAMVAACAARCGGSPRIDFAVMDACRITSVDFYDLICANLAAQWFDDLPATLDRLMQRLAPGGLLALSLLGADTFREWRTAHEQLGLTPGTPVYSSPDQYQRALSRHGCLRLDHECWSDSASDAMAFLRSLRAIGADTPVAGHMPLSAAELRRVMRVLAPTTTYQLIYAGLVRQ